MNPILFLFLLTAASISAQNPNLAQLSYTDIDSFAQIEYDNGNYTEAILYIQTGREKAKKEFGEMDSLYADYTSSAGFFYNELGMYEKAEEFLLEAEKIYAKVRGEQHPDYGNNLANLASLYHGIGDYEKSERLYLKVKDLDAKNYGEQSAEFAMGLNNLALLYQDMANYEVAEQFYLQSKDIRANLFGESHQEFAESLNNLATFYLEIGSYERAESFLLQAKSIEEKILGAEHPDFATSLNNLALLYKNMGQYEKAEPLFLQALQIIEKAFGTLHPLHSSILANLALLYHNMGNYAKAESFFLKAKSTQEKTIGKASVDFVSTINNLALLYQDMGQYDKAKVLLLESINLRAKIYGKDHPRFGASLADLGSLYRQTDQLDSAMRYYQLAIEVLSTELESSFADVTPRGEAGDVPLGFQDWANLDKYKYTSNEDANFVIQGVLEVFGTQYAKTKDKAKLQARYQIAEAAMRLNERIRNDFSGEGDKLRVLSMSNHYVLKGIETAIELAEKGYQEAAFGFAELNKGALLMDAAKTGNAHKFGNLPDNLAAQEELLQKKHANLQAQLLEPRPKSEKDSLLNLMNKIKQEIEIFTKKLKAEYPQYAALKYESKTASAKEIQALLDEKTALLEYVIGDSIVYIFYIDKNKVELFEKPISATFLATKIKKLHHILSNYKLIQTEKENAYQQYTENAYWFYENIVSAALKDKAIEKLIIVSDGELGHLPFEAFLTKAAPQRETDYHLLHYLTNDYKISYHYSATLFADAMRNSGKKANPNNGQLLAMTANYDIKLDVVHNTKNQWRLPIHQHLRTLLKPLPAARKEVETLATMFDGFFAFDKDASEKKFKEKAGDYAVIHLAMHGLLDAKNPILSSLAFTEDGDSLENNFLQAYEISKMKLNADLVVLSACETGYGRFEKGNGIASLAQAFAYAGAPAMIVSLWQVSDYATSEIMKNLYQNLSDGMEKDEALQEAKMKYMKEAKGVMAHPAFWSPFILMGNTDAIYLKKKGGYFWWFIGGAILALGSIAFAIRSRKKE